MVDKPTEGICGACDSESLEFFDDGSGRCTDCDRMFRWAPEKEDGSEDVKKTSRITSRSNGFNPAKRPAASLSDRYSRYLKVLVVGFLLLIAGYSLMFSMHAVTDWQEEPLELASTFIILSLLFVNVGVVLIGFGLVLGAVKAEHLDDDLRGWMFMAMAVLLGVFLGLGNFLLVVNLL